jgi:hypothetical protein
MIGTHWYPQSYELEVRPGVYLSMPARYVYNGGSSRMSSQLIRLAGLDPTFTTVQDMDAKDPRFVHNNHNTARGYPIFTWRAAVRFISGSLLAASEIKDPRPSAGPCSLAEGRFIYDMPVSPCNG